MAKLTVRGILRIKFIAHRKYKYMNFGQVRFESFLIVIATSESFARNNSYI
jgi:hypothetical protein